MLINMNFFSDGHLDLNKLRNVLIRMEVCFDARDMCSALQGFRVPRGSSLTRVSRTPCSAYARCGWLRSSDLTGLGLGILWRRTLSCMHAY